MPSFFSRSGGWAIFPLIFTALLLGACDKGPEGEKAPESVSTPAEESPQVSTPGPVTGMEALPPGHPPFEGMPAAMPGDAPGMPAGHPAMPSTDQLPVGEEGAAAHPVSTNKELAINLPESVAGKWSAVMLEVTMADGNKNTIEVALGGETSLQGSNLIIRAEAFVPSYKSDFKTITSASNALDNPAAKVALVENDQVVAKGWIFQNLPEFNSFASDKVSIRLLAAAEAGSSSDTQAFAQ